MLLELFKQSCADWRRPFVGHDKNAEARAWAIAVNDALPMEIRVEGLAGYVYQRWLAALAALATDPATEEKLVAWLGPRLGPKGRPVGLTPWLYERHFFAKVKGIPRALRSAYCKQREVDPEQCPYFFPASTLYRS